MYPVSEDFLAAVRTSHRAVSRADAYIDGELVCELPFIDGAVTMDSRRDGPQRTLALTVSDGPRVSRAEALEALDTPGCEVHVSRGVRLPAGDELVPLGVFAVEGYDRPSRGAVPITGSDRSSLVSANRFQSPYQVAKGATLGLAVSKLLLDRRPDLPIGWTPSPHDPATGDFDETVAGAIYEGGSSSDPWRDANALVEAHGLYLYCDGNGVAQIIPVPDYETAMPDLEYAYGEVVIDPLLKVDLKETYSGVCVTAEGTSLEKPIQWTSWDMDPRSKTYVDGPFGRRVFFYSSPFIKTLQQCKNAARSMLSKKIGRSSTYQWTQVPNPAHEPFDVVGYAGGVNILDQVVVPLRVTEAMTCVARETRTAW